MSKRKSLFFFWIATVKSEAHVPVSGFITLLPRLSPRTLSFVPLLFMTQWIVQMGTHSDSLSLTALMASHSAVYMKSEWNSCVKNNKKSTGERNSTPLLGLQILRKGEEGVQTGVSDANRLKVALCV